MSDNVKKFGGFFLAGLCMELGALAVRETAYLARSYRGGAVAVDRNRSRRAKQAPEESVDA